MTKRPFLIFGLILLVFISSGLTQPAQVDINLLISPTLKNARVVYISSFDLLQQGSADFLFQLTISSNAEARGYLVFQLSYNEEPLAEARTNVFNMPAGIHNINNIQLANGYRFPNGEAVKFDESSTRSPDEEFEKETTQGGKLPAGKYYMTVDFYFDDPGQEPVRSGEFLDVISSAYVIPVAPGSEGGLTNPSIIYTEFPVFQFNTDFYNDPDLIGTMDPFNVRVYKVLPDQHTSVDEALSGTPHLDVNTSFTLFQYPQNSADDQGILTINEFQPLTTGTYVWRVLLSIQTTGGTEYIESPIFGFKLVDPNSVSENLVQQAATQQIFQILRFLIGEEANEIENQLSDFNLTSIVVDGQKIELSELYQKINQYANKVIKIENMELRSSQE